MALSRSHFPDFSDFVWNCRAKTAPGQILVQLSRSDSNEKLPESSFAVPTECLGEFPEVAMSKRSWIRNLFARPVTRLMRKAPHRAGLVLEALEDRFVSSVTAPTTARNLAAVTVNEGSPATNGGTFHDAEGRATVTLTALLGTRHAPDRRQLSWPDATANRERQSPARSPRPTIGFWLGGGLLGTGGCILGICMPSHHPVAVVISALWWGIYLGCLGGSVGALIAWFTERAPAPTSRGVDGRS